MTCAATARLSIVGALFTAALPGQILTTDAGVRSPQLPSVRTLLAYTEREISTDLTALLQLTHSPTTTLETGLEVPLIDRDIDAGTFDGQLSGLGDASVYAKYALLRDDDVMRSNRLALTAALHLPTGEHDEVLDGQLVPRRLQLGIGSFGIGLGGAATIVRDRHRASLAASWTRYGAHDGFTPGDEFAVDAAYWYRISPARFHAEEEVLEWRGVAELRSRYGARDRLPSGASSDRGLDVDALLGLQVHVGAALRGELGVVLPLRSGLDSPAGDLEFGLLAGFTVFF
jgi:hypothetical protein